MKLKTFQAQTMADALAAVRKDLGPDAMILHTRSYRVGSWLGFGGKNMVEITASASDTPEKSKRPARGTPARASSPQPASPSASADDRSQVLGGATQAARAMTRSAYRETERMPARESLRELARDPAEIVVQRASAIIEPKPILTRPARPDASPPSVPVRGSAQEPGTPRPGIATRLPRRDGASPVRLSDATPLPEQPAAHPAERSPDPTRVLDGFRRSMERGHDRESVTHQGPEHQAPPQDRSNGRSNDARTVEPKPPVKPQTPPASQSENDLRQQIAGLEKMMGRVLESTRRTSIAVGRVSENAADPVEAGPLLDLTNKLVENDAPMAAVDAIIGRVRDRLDRRELEDATVVRQAVLREIEDSIATKGDSLLAISTSTATGVPRIISLIGPTGVGKTTTVAKLAAACKLRHGKRVGLITSDTYRIAAVEQLRTYAGIIGLPIKVVMTPEEMSAAIESLQGMDVIIVDTAGRSQHDGKRLEELKAFVAAADPDETHLVLSSTVGNTVLERTAQKFKPLGPDRVILTKLDEAVCTGHLAGLTGRLGLPLSFITVGQEVPDDIEPARADRLARVALDGPDVLFGGSDGRG